MTQAPELPPLHMRRDGFNPADELREIRETTGVQTALNAFGMSVYLVTRHHDIKDEIGRRAPGHLAFGHGVAEPFDDVQFRTFNFIYGLRSLEVSW